MALRGVTTSVAQTVLSAVCGLSARMAQKPQTSLRSRRTALHDLIFKSYNFSSRLISADLKECVRAPTEMKSTPVNAYSRTLPR